MSTPSRKKENLRETYQRICDLTGPTKRYNGYEMGHCPVHGKGGGDRTPSLSISLNDDETKILLHCQAGCETTAILKELALTFQDLFANEPAPKLLTTKKAAASVSPLRLHELAAVKSLPVTHLEKLGLKDETQGVLVPYLDGDGQEITFKIRLRGDPKYISRKGGGVHLYGEDHLPLTRERGEAILVEGESDCWTLWYYGLPALGIPGVQNTKVLLKKHLDKLDRVYLCREKDDAGSVFIQTLAGRLYHHGYKGQVFVIEMPGDCKDPSDLHIALGDETKFREAWEQVVRSAQALDIRQTVHEQAGSEREAVAHEEAKADPLKELYDLALGEAEILLDEDTDTAIARIEIDGEPADCPVMSGGFKSWLTRLYQERTGRLCKKSYLDDVVHNLAVRYSERVKTYTRIASLPSRILYDLGRGGKAVEVTPGGWRVLDRSPVVFFRGLDMAPQVKPLRGGSVEELRRFVNISDDDFPLLLAFLVDALKGRKPYTFLAVLGGPGSGKSMFCHFIKSLLDPNKRTAGLTIPRKVSDLAILARHRFLIDFDNVSRISEEMSDALCRLSTGSGFVVRKLYSDDDEKVFSGTVPVLLNGVPDFVERSDLQSRVISVRLRKIEDEKRLPEEKLLAEFNRRKPYILGALFDLIGSGLRHKDSVAATGGPRMMDTYLWLLACETGTDYRLGDAYRSHVDAALADMAKENLLVKALIAFLAEYFSDHPDAEYQWQGTASDLYEGLKRHFPQGTRKEISQFPGNARVLSNRLGMLQEPLHQIGVEWGDSLRSKAQRLKWIDASRYFRKEGTAPPEARPSREPPAGAVVQPAEGRHDVPGPSGYVVNSQVHCDLLPPGVPAFVAARDRGTGGYALRFQLSDEQYRALPEEVKRRLYTPSRQPENGQWRIAVQPHEVA